jgi:hypothetical protein
MLPAPMKPDDIISYSDLVCREKANLLKEMNFGIGKKYSVFLMSARPGPTANHKAAKEQLVV